MEDGSVQSLLLLGPEEGSHHFEWDSNDLESLSDHLRLLHLVGSIII